MSASFSQVSAPGRSVFPFESPAPVEILAPGTLLAHGRVVQRLNPIRDERWNDKLAAVAPDAFFPGKGWALVLAQTYGYAPEYFAEQTGGRLEALLPVMEVDSWLTGRRGISLPFTDYCDPLAADAAAFRQLFDAAVAHGRSRRWKYLELRGGQPFLAAAPPAQQYYGHEISLAGEEPELFAALKPATRRAVRKAQNEGVTVEFRSDARGIRQFYALHCRTRRKHGLPPQPLRFFLQVQERILDHGDGIVVLARAGARCIAGAVFFQKGATALYKFGASDERTLRLRGNDLVIWEGIRHYAARGCRKLYMGRTSPANEGLLRFKRGWGAREYPIPYYRYDLRKNAFVPGHDETVGWHNRVFGALPLSLSRLLGALLYRHVA